VRHHIVIQKKMVVGTFLNSPLSPHPVLLRSYLSPIFIHPSYLKKLCRKIQSFMLRDKESERNSHKKKLSTVALVYFLWIIWQFLPISSNLGRIIWVLEHIKFPSGRSLAHFVIQFGSVSTKFKWQRNRDKAMILFTGFFWKIYTQWIWPFTAYSS